MFTTQNYYNKLYIDYILGYLCSDFYFLCVYLVFMFFNWINGLSVLIFIWRVSASTVLGVARKLDEIRVYIILYGVSSETVRITCKILFSV